METEKTNEVETCVARSTAAGEILAGMEQEQLDRLAAAVSQAGRTYARELAELAVEETGFGVVEDKIVKNRFAAERVWQAIRGMRVVGLLGKNEAAKTWEYGVPVGVVAALVPSTNPTSTTIYKALICLKAGNSVIFSPHPAAVGCTLRAVERIRNAIVRAGGPADAVTALEEPTPAAARALMAHPGVRLILATGSGAMVRAAYASGTPAIGVGAGNSPVYFHPSCDLAQAVRRVMASKTFDNGTVCASEQAVVVERTFALQVREEFQRQGGYFLDPIQREALKAVLLREDGRMAPAIVGRPVSELCRLAGLTDVPDGVRVLLAPEDGVGEGHPFSGEKLGLVLAYYEVADEDEALTRCVELLRHEGAGHTLALHTEEDRVVEKFARASPVSRVLVNTPAALGGIGATTDLFPALTLGCGAAGGSSTSDNIGPRDLVNIKRVAWGRRELEDLRGTGRKNAPNNRDAWKEPAWPVREPANRAR